MVALGAGGVAVAVALRARVPVLFVPATAATAPSGALGAGRNAVAARW
jgi:hypothetical protein